MTLLISEAASLAQAAAEELAAKSGGYCEVHLLLVDWSHLPMPRSAIARGLRTPGVWPTRSQLINDIEQSQRGAFSARHSLSLDPYALLTEAHRLSEDRHARILESDMF